MKRNTFLKAGGIGLIGLSVPAVVKASSPDDTQPLDIAIVKDFVGAGHGRFERVKELLAEFPNLKYARYDWGNGDFESALEAASHVGNREIAGFLVDSGARINLGAITMLGETALVKAILNRYPHLLYGLGAHGFTLLHHAKVGGPQSEELFDYLSEAGLTEMQVKIK